MRFFSLICKCFIFATCLTAQAAEKQSDLDFEQALYEHLQERYLNSITLSEVLRDRSDKINIKQQVLLSSSYYNYRLPQISLDLLSHGLNVKVNKADEDILLFQIAKNQYNDKQIDSALITFNKIIAPINKDIEVELNYLKADIYILKNNLEKAKELALKLNGNAEYFPFIAHNLAIAYLNANQFESATFWINALNNEQYKQHQKLKDSLLLSSGITHLRQKNYNGAIESILKIKKESSFASKGLLALGQALVLNKDISEGKRFFNYLSNYPKQNIYYQESLLYLAETDDTGSATPLYKHAISNYDELLSQVYSLTSEEMSTALSTCLVTVIDNPICTNIHLWIKSFENTKAFKSHLTQNQQLITIQQTLFDWSQKLSAYKFILQQRKDDFDQKLPQINQQLNPEQLLEFQQQFNDYQSQVQTLKQMPSDFDLINEDESDHLDDIYYVDVSVKRLNTLEKSDKETISELQMRAQFTKGILMWELAQQKPLRLRQVTKNLNKLDSLLKSTVEGMKKLQKFNNSGDARLSRLSQELKQANNTLFLLQNKVDQLITQNKQQLTIITQAYLQQRKATLIHLNSRSKYLLTQLQDVQ